MTRSFIYFLAFSLAYGNMSEKLSKQSLIVFFRFSGQYNKQRNINCVKYARTQPVDTGRKLNVHKMFRRRSGCLLNILYTFNLRPVSMGQVFSNPYFPV